MSLKIIGEIGLNHLGKNEILNEYVNKFKNKGLNAITIQIFEDNQSNFSLKKYRLERKYIRNFIKKAKNNFDEVGLAIFDWKDFDFLKSLNLDFIKLLSKSFENYKYIKKIQKLNLKQVYLSTGLSSNKKISQIISKLKKQKLNLIHTSFNENNIKKDFKKMEKMRKLDIPVCFGSHYKNKGNLLAACKHDPKAIFFYLKLNKKLQYPDNKHAIPLNKIKFIINNIKKI